MKNKKIAALLLSAALTVSMLAGCGDNDTGDTNDGSNTPTSGSENPGTSGEDSSGGVSSFIALDKDTAGELSVMLWSGDGEYYEDIGSMTLEPENITAENVAAVYAMAKKFKESYPNVKINLYAKTGGANDNDTSWAQEMENFKAQHGKYPDIWSVQNLVGDVEKGLVADLSVFSDDPVYQSYNSFVMNQMNYYGMQAGLPLNVQPWGVYINTELAEQNNIDVPDPDWTIEDYTDFIAQGDKTTFWGAMDIPISWIASGTKDIMYSLTNYDGTGDFVNLDSDAVKDLLSLVPVWADNTIWPQSDIGAVPGEIMDDGWWWSQRFFSQGYILVNDNDPWSMGAYANPEATDESCKFEFDIYPRPATDYRGNTVGISFDPMAIHNYAMDDGNPEWSESEDAALKLAYTFATYWTASTEAFQARYDMSWNSGGALRPACSDFLPNTTGAVFDEQMKIWYSAPTHAYYENKPGWNKVLEVWNSGMTDVSDKTFPSYIQEDGVDKACLYEWTYYYDAAQITALRASDAWLDEIKSKLPEWNKLANERYAQAWADLQSALVDFYGYSEADFN